MIKQHIPMQLQSTQPWYSAQTINSHLICDCERFIPPHTTKRTHAHVPLLFCSMHNSREQSYYSIRLSNVLNLSKINVAYAASMLHVQISWICIANINITRLHRYAHLYFQININVSFINLPEF